MQYISISSGSKGNCHYIEKNNASIIIDVGLSGKSTFDNMLKHDIDTKNIRALFITHEHSDHIKGAGILSRKLDIPIYATEKTWQVMEKKIGQVSEKNIKIIENTDITNIGDMQITSMPIKHDAVDPVAYRITDGIKSLSIITDLGIITQSVFDAIKKSDTVVLEANHDINMLDAGPYSYELKRRIKSNFGHLSNDSAGIVASDLVKLGTKKIFLAHLSDQNNMPVLAYQSVMSILQENGIKVGSDLELSVLEQLKASKKIAV